ncbi:MAG: rRNA maturation RNase YbeY [Rhodospirillales bacterium]|nr:rRNA maturation RNase YbeY [Rhodospirillales bacterium]
MSEEPPSPNVEIKVLTQDPGWAEALDRCEELAERAARAALQGQNALVTDWSKERPVELSLVLANDGLLRRLNRDFRGRDASTNVLSFADFDRTMAEAPGPVLLGDVILARETLILEAHEQNKSVADHLAHLVVHGVLHLLGHDHEDPSDAEAMETLERDILAGLEIADPYLPRDGAPQPSQAPSRAPLGLE